jgi:twitching motility protein PilI
MARTAKLDLRAFQQELATRLASKTAAQVESSRLGLSFGGGNWLIRLSDAGEVVPLPPIAAVPLTKPWFLGITNIRGNLHGVIDFAAFCSLPGGAPAKGTGGQARLILLGPRTGELKAGVVVDRVIGLRNIAEFAPVAARADAPAWYGQRWMDGDGVAWQEIDLTRLARDPAFLQVGV